MIKPIETIAPVLERESNEHPETHIVYDGWEFGLIPTKETPREDDDPLVALIGVIVFILVVLCVIFISFS